MLDPNYDAQIQEVDDELRKEQLTALWKAYGKYIIGVAVGIVLVVAGRQVWTEYTRTKQESASAAYEAVITESRDASKNPVDLWQGAKGNMKGGYQSMAGFRLAAAELDAGNSDAALAALDAVSAKAGGDADLKALAQLQASMILVQAGDYSAARGRLDLLKGDGKPWHYSAMELLALIDVEEGFPDAALAKYMALNLDPNVPATMQERVGKMQAVLEARLKADQLTSGQALSSPAVDGVKTAEPDTDGEKENDPQ